jgi:hypothetical protein
MDGDVIMDGIAAVTMVGTVGTGGTHGKISDRRVSMSCCDDDRDGHPPRTHPARR